MIANGQVSASDDNDKSLETQRWPAHVSEPQRRDRSVPRSSWGTVRAKKDQGAWTLPKGEYEADEDPLVAAQREFQEETGFIAFGNFIELGSVRQKSGKIVIAWAFEGDCDPVELVSNTCDIEWPPRSGKMRAIPEVDRGQWYELAEANKYIRAEQRKLLDMLVQQLAIRHI